MESAMPSSSSSPRPSCARSASTGLRFVTLEHGGEKSRHLLPQSGRPDHLDLFAQSQEIARADSDGFNRHRASYPAVLVRLARGLARRLHHRRPERLQLGHAGARYADIGSLAVESHFIGARGLLPVFRQIEILRPREFFIEHHGIEDRGHTVGANALPALSDEVPDAALEHEAERTELALAKLRLPRAAVAQIEIAFAPKALGHRL